MNDTMVQGLRLRQQSLLRTETLIYHSEQGSEFYIITQHWAYNTCCKQNRIFKNNTCNKF